MLLYKATVISTISVASIVLIISKGLQQDLKKDTQKGASVIENRITSTELYMMEGKCDPIAAGHTEHVREAPLFHTPIVTSPLLPTLKIAREGSQICLVVPLQFSCIYLPFQDPAFDLSCGETLSKKVFWAPLFVLLCNIPCRSNFRVLLTYPIKKYSFHKDNYEKKKITPPLPKNLITCIDSDQDPLRKKKELLKTCS